MKDQGKAMIDLFDYVWERLKERVAGLDDDEYYWEPVARCWTLRVSDSGEPVLDGDGGGGPAPDPVPFTTIAWRIGHICDRVLAQIVPRILKTPAGPDIPRQPGSVEKLPEYMDACYGIWRDWLEGVPDETWNEELGPDWEPYDKESWLALALHIFDELSHHGAEVGVLRDLYSQRDTLTQGAAAADPPLT
jgi:hypothetical protein